MTFYETCNKHLESYFKGYRKNDFTEICSGLICGDSGLLQEHIESMYQDAYFGIIMGLVELTDKTSEKQAIVEFLDKYYVEYYPEYGKLKEDFGSPYGLYLYVITELIDEQSKNEI